MQDDSVRQASLATGKNLDNITSFLFAVFDVDIESLSNVATTGFNDGFRQRKRKQGVWGDADGAMIVAQRPVKVRLQTLMRTTNGNIE